MLVLDSGEPGRTVRHILRDGLIDGVLVSAVAAGEAWVEELLTADLPTVLIGSHPTRRDVDVVDVENLESSARLVEHLFEQGCTRIGTVTGPLERVDAATRLAGFRLAHERRGVPVDERLVRGRGLRPSERDRRRGDPRPAAARRRLRRQRRDGARARPGPDRRRPHGPRRRGGGRLRRHRHRGGRDHRHVDASAVRRDRQGGGDRAARPRRRGAAQRSPPHRARAVPRPVVGPAAPGGQRPTGTMSTTAAQPVRPGSATSPADPLSTPSVHNQTNTPRRTTTCYGSPGPSAPPAGPAVGAPGPAHRTAARRRDVRRRPGRGRHTHRPAPDQRGGVPP